MGEIIRVDVDGDGVEDTVDYTEYADGSSLTLADTNGDGVVDIASYDADGNGVPDAVAIDNNHDGTVDETYSQDRYTN